MSFPSHQPLKTKHIFIFRLRFPNVPIVHSHSAQLIPSVFKLQAWSMLHSLLEIISYRVHTQLQMSFRFSILQLLHSIAGVSIIPTQLFIR